MRQKHQQKNLLMSEQTIKHVNHLQEYETIQLLLERLSAWEEISRFTPADTVVLNVSPDYSSTVAMHIAHHLSKDGEMLPIIGVDVPYPDELDVLYKQEFYMLLQNLQYTKKKFILVEAAVLTGKNYTWMIEMMKGFGIDPDNIVTVALYERYDSMLKCAFVGEVFYTDMIEFYYERHNKHWS